MVIISLLAGSASAAVLSRIRFASFPDKIRAVLDFDGSFSYETQESKEAITLILKQTEASPEIPNFVEANDLIVRYFEVEKEGNDLLVKVPLNAPIEYNIFSLNDPPRLVIDFGREFQKIVSGGIVSDGVEYLKLTQGVPDGQIKAHVLRIDLNKAVLKPALARPQDPNIVNSLFNLVFPWTRPDSRFEHFYLDKVSNIAARSNAVAGVNGTFFASTGSPLGALMIDREIVSYPIYDRTAFFVDSKNTPYIDNIFVTSYIKLKNGACYYLTGINQGRGAKDVVMYTPAWGKETGTNTQGVEIAVSKNMITAVSVANTKVPDDGYVISVSGPGVESFYENVKAGDPVETSIKVVPFNTSPDNIVQLISGGPRLLKNGRTYISRNEEKFQMDIAKGRAARTAIGITKGGEILLVAVDGIPRKKENRSEKDSLGASLEELSGLMLSLGAVDAMNLDGGGSTTMVIKGQVVNNPASGFQRGVSNALVVKKKF